MKMQPDERIQQTWLEMFKGMVVASETKYCSVGAMISRTAKIETTFEILPEVAPEDSTEAA
jgi:hypothetical protein